MIGKVIYLNSFRFQIEDADEYSQKYMEDNTETFPQSSIKYVVNKIKEGANAFPSLQEYAVHLIKTLDKDGDNFISFEEFKAGLQASHIFLTDHETHTLVRFFDQNGDGKISMEEFYNALSQD